MKRRSDTWCRPVLSRHGNMVSGGAARNIRIAEMGGMDEIVETVARNTLELANMAVQRRNRSQIKLVSNA